ncbi:hypothetical protein CHUAL_012321 [Chamberlinius hualienensis]
MEDHYYGCKCIDSSQDCSDSGCECIYIKNCELKNYRKDSSLVFYNLETAFLDKPVLECNMHCLCSQNCSNRVTQKGIQHRLCVFKSNLKGWCLKTLEPIPTGRFICEYAGEIIDYSEARRRSLNQTESDKNYIHVLNEHLSHESVVQTYIDPTYKGNFGRFINHSCDSNLIMISVRINSVIPTLALFTRRDIMINEELCFDYSGRDAQTSSDLEETEKQKRKQCHCQAPNCKGYLPFDRSLFK